MRISIFAPDWKTTVQWSRIEHSSGNESTVWYITALSEYCRTEKASVNLKTSLQKAKYQLSSVVSSHKDVIRGRSRGFWVFVAATCLSLGLWICSFFKANRSPMEEERRAAATDTHQHTDVWECVHRVYMFTVAAHGWESVGRKVWTGAQKEAFES